MLVANFWWHNFPKVNFTKPPSLKPPFGNPRLARLPHSVGLASGGPRASAAELGADPVRVGVVPLRGSARVEASQMVLGGMGLDGKTDRAKFWVPKPVSKKVAPATLHPVFGVTSGRGNFFGHRSWDPKFGPNRFSIQPHPSQPHL